MGILPQSLIGSFLFALSFGPAFDDKVDCDTIDLLQGCFYLITEVEVRGGIQ